MFAVVVGIADGNEKGFENVQMVDAGKTEDDDDNGNGDEEVVVVAALEAEVEVVNEIVVWGDKVPSAVLASGGLPMAGGMGKGRSAADAKSDAVSEA
ncbi:hypothetical protein HDU84_009800 [Entophlyctis sp. JEL0112]|nr:hypothetical protein HDU84_009800 [Entophlyctis sp. JEL0112]